MREWVVLCEQTEAENLSDILVQYWEMGVLSVSVEDADEGTDQEMPLFGEPGEEIDAQAWQRNRVVCLLSDELDLSVLQSELARLTGKDYQTQSYVRDVPDEDWVRLTQAQFEPIQISERVWIVPSWHKDDPRFSDQSSDLIQIELDPGLAFGTGSHPTTHLCATALCEMDLVGQSVLDYGCGSGILSLVASKLDAQMVVGVDIDPQAVQSATYNAQNNHASVDFFLPAQLPEGRFDVVVANILTNPLKMLAPMLCERVKSGGVLILSGILETQAQEVIEVYSKWLEMQVYQSSEDWVCLRGYKKN
ncbi:MAG: 50S ribosomal protein L11 methyltransferase [Alcaligenaceae bacterium]|nr:50S ribosomal protein L11 methyltransferase [Alcaligenaceae bacterium]